MDKYIINTGTITYALRARDALRNKGIKAFMFRNTGKSAVGCGYSVSAIAAKSEIENILNSSGVKFISITPGEVK